MARFGKRSGEMSAASLKQEQKRSVRDVANGYADERPAPASAGAQLAGEGALETAIAGKPHSYRSGGNF
jgi:hypothetical protein